MILVFVFLLSAIAIHANENAASQTRTNHSFECISIIAVASTRDPHHGLFDSGKYTNITDGRVFVPDEDDREQFDCLLSSGYTVPIVGTDDQLELLREHLHQGELISGETTLNNLSLVLDKDVNYSVHNDSEVAFIETIQQASVTLPPGKWRFKPTTRDNSRFATANRRLATYEGIKKVLVVRLIDKNGLANPDSPSVMSDKIFGTYGDDYTMSSQFEACSFGKMIVSNDYGFTIPTLAAPGVVEVTFNADLKTQNIFNMRNEFQRATEAHLQLGKHLNQVFDHVLFIVEGCYVQCGWAGFAQVNSWLSVYHSHHYKAMAVTLHEVGHNLNFAHSGGSDGREYTDHSCLMGNPWFKDDKGQMCFNSAKTWQIAAAGAWYDQKHTITWNSGTNSPKYWRGNLIGVADYANNPLDAALVVKLETGVDRAYFVGFNRAYGINIDSKDANDMVTIVEAGNNNGYSKSIQVTQLGSGQSYSFINWRGSGKTLIVKISSINKSTIPWLADVELNFNNAPIPTNPPSKRPSNADPTKKPTLFPTSSSPVTSPPTRKCGNAVCMPDETEVDCPEDCSNVEFVTYENNIGNKGANGTMFSVQAVRDVAITSISGFFRSLEQGLVQIYTKPGSYIGFESNETAWDLIYENLVFQNGPGVLTELGSFTNKVIIVEGEIQSFYVYSPNNLAYRQGFDEGDLVQSDAALNFYSGIAIAYGKFAEGQRFSPREFSGILRYDGILVETLQPTPSPAAPTSIPSVQPSLQPTASSAAPTSIPSGQPSLEPSAIPVGSLVPTKKPANLLCYTLETQEQCIESKNCRWLEVIGGCRRNRVAGKASKRMRGIAR